MYSTISQWIGFYFSEMGLLLSFKSPGNLQDYEFLEYFQGHLRQLIKVSLPS